MVPFFLERLDEMFGTFSADSITFAQTFLDHVYVAPSGIWSYPMLDHAIAVVGADRIVYSVDYRFQTSRDGFVRQFLEKAPISRPDKHKVGHQNIERLLGIKQATRSEPRT